MSLLVVAPELLVSAAANLESIGAALNGANAAAAVPTTGLLAAGADEVSAAVAALFAEQAREYQALSAQVNAFQAPASMAHPMFEEFYYVDLETNYAMLNNQPNGHFRHAQKANVTSADGHVALEKPVAGSIDKRLPNQVIAQLRPEILAVP